ncbi:hypothetical protein AVEN_196706-1 [Araneus ventricosus]|uniref:Uncharacterized protein n=1 Tax=Araneus ventricosus TaxID=182803 RepID=A0A4Y2GZ91_ARAVE|nr:hypothetical protein AVEN_196706-1 [Araneus ventricosus]
MLAGIDLWATSCSRVPVDGAAIASDVRESSFREEKTTRRYERRWFGFSRPKHEMKRRDDLKDDMRC